MVENVDSVRGVMGKMSSGLISALCSSLEFAVNISGKSVGYAGRAVNGVFDATKKIIGYGSQKSAGMFTGGLRKKFGLTKTEVQAKVAVIDNIIRELYLEIGKMGGASSDINGVLVTPEAAAIIEKIKKLEDESSALNKYLADIETAERQGLPIEKFSVKPRGVIDAQLFKRMRSVAEHCTKKARFSLRSDAIIFEKALRDLLESEMDIKRLAVSELGKLSNKQAGPVLKEALAINDSELQAEIINALIQIDDGDILAICKRHIQHPYAGVRTACVRGLYKAGNAEVAPLLIEAMKDENMEVRNSSAMFLGWLESKEALPSLLQVATADPDSRVRKSAIQALENIRDQRAVLPLIRLLNDEAKDIREKVRTTLERITGESLDVTKSDDPQEWSADIKRLKAWWINKKHEITNGAATQAQAEADAAVTPEAPAADEREKPGTGA